MVKIILCKRRRNSVSISCLVIIIFLLIWCIFHKVNDSSISEMDISKSVKQTNLDFNTLQRMHKLRKTGDVDIAITIFPHMENSHKNKESLLEQQRRIMKLLRTLLRQFSSLQSNYSYQISICTSTDDLALFLRDDIDDMVDLTENFHEFRMNIEKAEVGENQFATQQVLFRKCLEVSSMKWNARYVMMLEDTILLKPNFIETLDFILTYQIDNIIRRGEVFPTRGNLFSYTCFHEEDPKTFSQDATSYLKSFLKEEITTISFALLFSSAVKYFMPNLHFRRTANWALLTLVFACILTIVDQLSGAGTFRCPVSIPYSINFVPSNCDIGSNFPTLSRLYSVHFARKLVFYLDQISCHNYSDLTKTISVFAEWCDLQGFAAVPASIE